MKILAVFSHAPSEGMIEWLKVQSREGVVLDHTYKFNVTQIKDIERGLTGVLLNMVGEVRRLGFELDQFDRVLVVPPAMSLAVMGFMEGMRGLFGRYPEMIRTMPDPDGSGQYLPCPEEPLVRYNYLFDRMRKERPPAKTNSTVVR